MKKLIALALVATLAACGEGSSNQSPEPTASETPAPAETPETEAEV